MSNSVKKRIQDYRVINKGRIIHISWAPRKELDSKQSISVRSLGMLKKQAENCCESESVSHSVFFYFFIFLIVFLFFIFFIFLFFLIVFFISHSVLSDSVWPHRLGPTRLLCLWNFLGKNTGVGCCFLLQGNLSYQGSNLGLLHCKEILYF